MQEESSVEITAAAQTEENQTESTKTQSNFEGVNLDTEVALLETELFLES